MRGFAVALVLVMACSGKSKHVATAGSGSQAVYAKKTSVSWGITGGDVFLQLTDETGKQTSYPLGTYQGECKVITPAAEMKAMTGVSCTGVELDAVVSADEIIVLKGNGTDPMSREEVTRVKAPGGSAVIVGQ
jgi:hypothetical protein